MGDLAESILRNLSDEDALDSVALARRLGVDHQKVIGGVKSLQSLDDLVAVEPISAIQWVLTGEGESVRNAGSYEFLVFDAISNDAGVLLDDIMVSKLLILLKAMRMLACANQSDSCHYQPSRNAFRMRKSAFPRRWLPVGCVWTRRLTAELASFARPPTSPMSSDSNSASSKVVSPINCRRRSATN